MANELNEQKTNTKNPNACALYKKCGGCQLQNLTYQAQLDYKQRKTQRLLGEFCKVDKIIGMKVPHHYRNKVQAAFGVNGSGRVVSGVYQSSTHRIVPVEKCMIEDAKADEIIGSVRRLLKSFKITAYNERNGRGFLRHVLVRRGFTTGQIMVVLVSSTPVFPSKNNFVKALLKLHPDITTVVHNINPYKTSLVLGDRANVLYGKGYIEDILCGCRFRISPKSFYQINPLQTERLYGKAVEFAELRKNETAVDAYCGVGTIGIIAAKSAGRVIGIELNADAVRDAKINAELNKTDNIMFFKGDAGEFMVEAARNSEHADVVFMDPPRAGSDESFLSSVVKLSPDRVVYISCNPETQQRDLKYLNSHGYKVKKIQPVDMFPHTNHVETVALLKKER